MTETEERLQTTCLLTISIIGTAFALYWLRPIMVPFVLALFLHLAITPVIDLFRHRLRIPHFLAVILTILLGIVLLVVLAFLITGSVGQLIANADTYQAHIKATIERVSSTTIFQRFGPNINELLTPGLSDIGEQLGSVISATLNAIANILSKGLLVFIFLMFLFMGSVRTAPSPNSVWQNAKVKTKSYISTKLLVSVIQGVLVWIVLSVLRVDLALMFGLFACILNFIPTIGPIIAALLPLPVVLVTPGTSLAIGISAIAVPGAIIFIIGNFVEPKVVGESLNLHPITILMALIFWGMLWGVVGMFLAIPLTAVFVLAMEEIETARPLADLMTIEKRK